MSYKIIIPAALVLLVIITAYLALFGKLCPCSDDCDPPRRECEIDKTEVQDKLNDCSQYPGEPYSEIREVGTRRIIETNGIPDHDIGIFGDDTDVIPCGRPNEIMEQDKIYRIPLDPGITKSGEKEYEYFKAPVIFGIAKNGIPFDPEAAEYYLCRECLGWQKSALNHPDMATDVDCNNGHVQPPHGAYHYHGLPTKFYLQEGGYIPSSGITMPIKLSPTLLGWGTDGVPIYGPNCLKEESENGVGITNYWRPKSGYSIIFASPIGDCVPEDFGKGYYDQDYEYKEGERTLDPCNGHFYPTPEEPDGEYHYHITTEFPHIPRCHTKMK